MEDKPEDHFNGWVFYRN